MVTSKFRIESGMVSIRTSYRHTKYRSPATVSIATVYRKETRVDLCPSKKQKDFAKVKMRMPAALLLLVLMLVDQSWAKRRRESCLPKLALGSCNHRPGQNEFWVYVFSTTGPPCWGLVSYHSGIGYTDNNGVSKYWYYGSEGVVGTKRGCSEDPNGIYSYKVLLGYLPKSMDEVQDAVDQLNKKKGFPCSNKNGERDCFTVYNYRLFTWNCNYFTAWVADELDLWENYPNALWVGRGIGKR